MRAHLRRLLMRAGIEAAILDRWEHILVARNLSALEPARDDGPARHHDRAMHLVVFDSAGQPVTYCKVRATDAESQRRARLQRHFLAHPPCDRIVPRSEVFLDGHLEVESTEFLAGSRLDAVLPRSSSAAQAAITQRVLDAVDALAQAARSLPSSVLALSATVDLAAYMRTAAPRLAHLGVGAENLESLHRAVAPLAPVPAVAQHGDLWSKNVFRAPNGDVRILDFDDFGRTQVPLFDTVHFVRTLSDLTSVREHRPWIERAVAPDERSRRMRSVLGEEIRRQRLDDAQAMACLVHYVAEITLHVHSRGAPTHVWRRFCAEVPAVAALLREAGSAAAATRRLTS